MSNDFKAMYESLKAEQVELNDKMKAARAEAIEHIQGIIDTFGITAAFLCRRTQGRFGRRPPHLPHPRPLAGQVPHAHGYRMVGQGQYEKVLPRIPCLPGADPRRQGFVPYGRIP